MQNFVNHFLRYSIIVTFPYKEPSHIPVNACLAPICSLHGLAVTTVEGIGSTRTRLHPVQERIAKAHGSQCGFCTPGISVLIFKNINISLFIA